MSTKEHYKHLSAAECAVQFKRERRWTMTWMVSCFGTFLTVILLALALDAQAKPFAVYTTAAFWMLVMFCVAACNLSLKSSYDAKGFKELSVHGYAQAIEIANRCPTAATQLRA